MNEVKVHYNEGMSFEAKTDRHALSFDLPAEKGGSDMGMSPPEVFISSLGACIGVYVVHYCQNARLDTRGLNISLSWKFSDDKAKISYIDIVVSLPNADVGKREKALLEVARHCLIHRTILEGFEIDISLVNR